MAGRGKTLYARRKVTYRLMVAQLARLDLAAKATGKSKTALVEDALGLYLNMLHQSKVI